MGLGAEASLGVALTEGQTTGVFFCATAFATGVGATAFATGAGASTRDFSALLTKDDHDGFDSIKGVGREVAGVAGALADIMWRDSGISADEGCLYIRRMLAVC
jgi:hypothetical protein